MGSFSLLHWCSLCGILRLASKNNIFCLDIRSFDTIHNDLQNSLYHIQKPIGFLTGNGRKSRLKLEILSVF